jgi:hypothetical protein
MQVQRLIVSQDLQEDQQGETKRDQRDHGIDSSTIY